MNRELINQNLVRLLIADAIAMDNYHLLDNIPNHYLLNQFFTCTFYNLLETYHTKCRKIFYYLRRRKILTKHDINDMVMIFIVKKSWSLLRFLVKNKIKISKRHIKLWLKHY